MDRKACKAAARASLRGAPVKGITLAFLLAVAALIGLEFGLTELAERLPAGRDYLSHAVSAGTRAYVLMVVLSLVCQLAMVLVGAGYASFALRLSRGQAFSLSTLWEGFRLWNRVLPLYVYVSVLLGLWGSVFALPVSYVLTALYMAGAIGEELLIGGLTAYLAAAMFVVSYRYRTVLFVLLDGPERPLREMVAVAKSVNKVHRWRLFVMDVSFLPWLLLCLLTGGVLLIWKLPYIAVSYARAHDAMLEDYAERQRRMEALLAEQQERLDHLRQP